jgi:transcriptional regulator with XRE-family HTH domain
LFETIEIKDVKRELGDLIKALRKQREFSQKELAERLNISRTTIQNLELGKNFTVDTVLKVMKEMDVLSQIHNEIKEAREHVRHSKSMY